MRIIEQSFEILHFPEKIPQMIELAGRTCYKSESKITEDSAEQFVKMLKNRGHHAMLEFGFIIVKFITNRGVTHELVRHRLCSFAQESTRYVKYSNDVEFIRPVWVTDSVCGEYEDQEIPNCFDETTYGWLKAMTMAEMYYEELLLDGWRPEQAREVLPNSLKTEIVVGANVREWLHIFELRTSPKAHPQMIALMQPLLEEFRRRLPEIFGRFEEASNDR